MKHMEVVGVRVEMPSNQPIVLLKESDGDRYLPIWIGGVEATAIALAQQGVAPARPLTHDLFRDVLEALDTGLQTVNITGLSDGIFYAELVLTNGAEVSARPSDSIALALRTGAPIYAHEDVIDEAGMPMPDEQEDQVEAFREFLDNISPEDFVPPRKFRAHRKDRPVTHLRLDCGQTVQSMEERKAALLTAYPRQ